MNTRYINFLTRIGLYLLLPVLMIPVVSHAEVSGVVMVVKGDVKITSKNKTDSAKVGRKVIEGDIIEAGADSRAKIVMSDKNVLNISPDTKMQIEKYENDGKKKNVDLKVMYGKIRASVEEKYDGEKNKFQIKTPAVVAGVRGTDYLMSYSRTTRESRVITFSGTVAVATIDAKGNVSKIVYVKQGQMTKLSDGAANLDAVISVPAEDLKQMNTESSAEAPQTTDTKKTEPQQAEKEKDKEAAKEDGKKDSAQADSKDKKDSADKKDKKDSKDGSSASTTADASAPVAAGDSKDSSSGGKDKKDGGRTPASTQAAAPAGSMIDSKDLSPDVMKEMPMQRLPAAVMPPSFTNPALGNDLNIPKPNDFVKDATRAGDAKVIIRPVPKSP